MNDQRPQIDGDATDSPNLSGRMRVDQLCDYFADWFDKHSGRLIEEFLDDEEQDFTQDFDKSLAIPELIAQEVDLRLAKGEALNRHAFYNRFPDHKVAVDQAFERVEEADEIVIEPSATQVDSDAPLNLAKPERARVPASIGHFQIQERVGAGAFGVVYRAVDTRSGSTVALKFPRRDAIISREELKLFLVEAAAARQLDHPGIVETFGAEHEGGYVFIVQQFVDGYGLDRTLESNPQPRQLTEILAQVAEAASYAHQKGLVHRDLKPSNVLMDQQGRPYIADFGLAVHESVQRRFKGQRCGSPAYMSPELVKGLTHQLDGRSDIWSLGVMLYQGLTGRKPFGGDTRDELYEEIKYRTAKPPRMIDPQIDPELERICLKCLAKPIRDRYLTAGDLARDLRDWLAGGPEKIRVDHSVAIVPQGLRSYGPEDADFFLQLLPGPRDKRGVPESVRFWKSRIDARSDEPSFPVGVLFGPSGCGKSSFVKAGLLPKLNRRRVEPIYVEATAGDTEVRLIKALRLRFPSIPNDLSLPEILDGLKARLWQPADIKTLIVLDQFEQWLYSTASLRQSQLAEALGHCDGQSLQCLLLVRDDFWLATSRFMNVLEIDVKEGENARRLDRFNLEHARRVLAEFGRAHGRLPVDLMQLEKEQEAFLDQAVEELAEDNRIICVRLSLFAEMFKNRPWTRKELSRVGGISGIGETFLEETFSSASAPPQYQIHDKAARAVLFELLPEAGRNIRGHMRSYDELLEASTYQSDSQRFQQLVQVLDQDLRLITPTDPDIGTPQNVKRKGTARSSCYQLTHDYLVPSIRDWLTSRLRRSRRGRAKLRLRELASQVSTGRTPRNLPTNFEWLAWQVLAPAAQRTSQEKTVMRYAGRRFAKSCAFATAIVAVFMSIVWALLTRDHYLRRVQYANSLVKDLLGQEVSRTPLIVDEIIGHTQIVRPLLQEIVDNPDADPRDRFRASLGLLPFDSTLARSLVAEITTPDSAPGEMFSVLELLSRYATNYELEFLSILNARQADPRSRFRAACALVESNSRQTNWAEEAGLLGSVLMNEPVSSRAQWIRSLTPIAASLRPTFLEMFSDLEEQDDAFVLATALYSFTRESERASYFWDLIPNSNDAQFDAILSAFEQENDETALRQKMLDSANNSHSDKYVAARAITLMRLGDYSEVAQRLSDARAGGVRAEIVSIMTPGRIRFPQIRALADLSEWADDDFRRSVLQAIGGYARRMYDNDLKGWSIDTAADLCKHDSDAGCHAAAELILQRFGQNDLEALRAYRQQTGAQTGRVFVNSQFQPFSIINLSEHGDLQHRIAVSTTELTKKQWSVFLQELGEPSELPGDPREPFKILDLALVYRYCNWLSEKDGIPRDQWCYPDSTTNSDLNNVMVDMSKTGYRLPMIDEWIVACQAGQQSKWFFGDNLDLSRNYAWTIENAYGELQPVALLLPNDFGMFDIFGNGYEICARRAADEQMEFIAMGQTSRQQRNLLSPWRDDWVYDPVQNHDIFLTLRVVRTMR